MGPGGCAATTTACSFAGVALREAGFTADAQPGEGVALERDGQRFAPFDDLRQLADGTFTADAWEARCAAAGVGDLRLDGAPGA